MHIYVWNRTECGASRIKNQKKKDGIDLVLRFILLLFLFLVFLYRFVYSLAFVWRDGIGEGASYLIPHTKKKTKTIWMIVNSTHTTRKKKEENKKKMKKNNKRFQRKKEEEKHWIRSVPQCSMAMMHGEEWRIHNNFYYCFFNAFYDEPIQIYLNAINMTYEIAQSFWIKKKQHFIAHLAFCIINICFGITRRTPFTFQCQATENLTIGFRIHLF